MSRACQTKSKKTNKPKQTNKKQAKKHQKLHIREPTQLNRGYRDMTTKCNTAS